MEIKNRVVSYLLTWHPRMLDVPALDAWYKLVGDGALTYGESLKQKQCWYFEKYNIKTKARTGMMTHNSPPAPQMVCV